LSQLASSGASDQARRIYELATAHGCRRVAVVGLAKNCGKTTTLNALAAAAVAATSATIGVTSSGRDGELFDAITGLAKPPVRLPAGALVALAELTLASATCDLEVVSRTGITTGAGEIVVARARKTGTAEVFGCSRGADLASAIAAMEDSGAGACLIDGAAGRTFLASPDVADSIVVATGAALCPDVDTAATATAAAVHLLSLGQPDQPFLACALRLQAAGESALVGADGTLRPLGTGSLLGKGEAVVQAADEVDATALVCAKAVGSGLLDALASWLRARGRGRTNHGHTRPVFEVVAADPSRIAASAQSVSGFEAAAGALRVARRARVAAVTCNPTSPWAKAHDPKDFAARISRALGPMPVFDLVAGLSACRGVVDEA
jgi:hypothetical protein